MAHSLARRALAVVLLVLLSACGTASPNGVTADAGPLHLRVLATHDFHGALRPTTYAWSDNRPIGGASALKAVLAALEADCVCPTIWLDGGDQMQGTLDSNLTFGQPVVAMFNALGLDAAAVGNHELDWGVETLLSRQAEAQYAWLAANVYRRDTGERPAWATPYALVDRDGVRIGVVGYATTSTAHTVKPDIVRPFEFRPGVAGIRAALDAVYAEQPDFVVIVAHAGGDCEPDDCGGELVDLAAELPPGEVHLIAGGHDHAPGDGVVNAIPILRAGSSGRAVAVIDL
jgi:2',3'-cyclic-nucleotide 2'-phosphodiesterase/3'-nucleotidase